MLKKRNENGMSDQDVTDIAVSCDGTWQRRGHSSHNGIMNVISMNNGKIIDTEPFSKTCKSCNKMQNLKERKPEEYDQWSISHKCTINYTGSAPGMEVEGAKRIFGRSVEKHGVRYSDFYGDG